MRALRRGDIVALGPHRLMCGDAGDCADVARLMAGAKADLVFTSPPYLQQRTYGQAIACWDTLMQRVFGALLVHERTQILVNLGLVHRKGEWVPYWDGWIEWMRARGWRRFGWYVWNKGECMPGDRNGRLAPTFEFVFHFNRVMRNANRTIATKRSGQSVLRRRVEKLNGWSYAGGTCVVAEKKVMDGVMSLSPHKSGKIAHPAVFPLALPRAIHAAYTDPGEIVYDPFCGSGTSIIAAHQGGRIAYGMELEPTYCDIAVERWRKAREKAQAPKRSRRTVAPEPEADARQLSMFAPVSPAQVG